MRLQEAKSRAKRMLICQAALGYNISLKYNTIQRY